MLKQGYTGRISTLALGGLSDLGQSLYASGRRSGKQMPDSLKGAARPVSSEREENQLKRSDISRQVNQLVQRPGVS